jgi:hypothetical protein
MPKRLAGMGWTIQDNEESISLPTKIVNSKSWTGFKRTQTEKHHSRDEKLRIIGCLNLKPNLLEDL